MTDLILSDIQNLIDGWLKAESDGASFPVPFDLAWQIAGYSTKANAKAKGLNKLEKGEDFSSKSMKTGQGGRPTEIIGMTCDAFKHFCLMAKTEQGRDIRRYFIEAEKKWRMVQEHHPEVAEDIEGKRLEQLIRLEEVRYQKTKLACDMATMHGKQYAMAALGCEDSIVEVDRPILEVIDNRCGDRRRGMTTKQLNDWLLEKTGSNFKNGAQLKRHLESVAPELIDQVQRPINQDWIHEDNIDAAINILAKRPRQMLLGEQ